MLRTVCFLFLLLLFAACVKDKPQPAVSTPVSITSLGRVLVVNEGNFGSGNAAISLIDRSQYSSSEDAYRAANAEALGDVAQSISKVNGQFYVVVNNSGKIVVCDNELKKKTEIKGFNSPRYLLQVSPRKAYVSDLRAGQLQVLDLSANSISGHIPCAGWTEKMAQMYGKAYITNLRRNFLYIVDVAGDRMKDSIALPYPAGSIVTDAKDKIWVLCSGDKASALVCINPVSDRILSNTALTASPAFGLCTSAGGDSLYFLSGGIMRLVPGVDLQPKEIIDPGTSNYYGIGVDPSNGDIFVSDAVDYSQRSIISIYSSTLERKKILRAGVNASGFYFD